MTAFLIGLAVLAAGLALLRFGPKSWRTILMNLALVGVAGIGELLELAGAFDWRQVLDSKTAAWVILAVGVLGIVYRLNTKTAAGETPPTALGAVPPPGNSREEGPT